MDASAGINEQNADLFSLEAYAGGQVAASVESGHYPWLVLGAVKRPRLLLQPLQRFQHVVLIHRAL
ncbi:hypothetical protein Cmtc_49360 [Cupriavidus sp. TKC]|nr:hypothetical protein Cmtc_49360 [Cupriavidus sp. TKC]